MFLDHLKVEKKVVNVATSYQCLARSSSRFRV